MFATILPVFAPVVICILIGALWARSGQAFHSEFLGRLVMWVGAPCLIVGTLSSVEIDPVQFRRVVEATLLMLLVTAALAFIVCAVFRLPLRVFAVPLVFGNSGNMGLPLCLFAFGSEGLALSLGVFVITSFLHFSVGVAVLVGRAPGRELWRSPIVLSAVLALVMVVMDLEFPLVVENTVTLLGGMSIPLMLLTLGVSLSALKAKDTRSALGVGAARLVVGVSAGLITVELLSLEGLVRGVVLLQAATPAAVFNYLLAMEYRRQPERVAGMVMTSTLLSFVTIPVLLAWVI